MGSHVSRYRAKREISRVLETSQEARRRQLQARSGAECQEKQRRPARVKFVLDIPFHRTRALQPTFAHGRFSVTCKMVLGQKRLSFDPISGAGPWRRDLRKGQTGGTGCSSRWSAPLIGARDKLSR
jgi:hypothetical protein